MPLGKSPLLTPAKPNRSKVDEAIYRALPPNPRCPLESTDSSGDSALLQIPIWAVARWQTRRAEPNKPKRLKTLVINELAHETEKQTQARYQPCYQLLTAILAPILKKYEWFAPALLRIRPGHPPSGGKAHGEGCVRLRTSARDVRGLRANVP